MGAGNVAHVRTMSRELVHRASVHEVLLTDATRVGEDQFLFGVQWPRHHVITGPGEAHTLDDALLVEAIRQIGIATAHLFCEVPMDARFVARSIGFDWITAPPTFPFAPLNGVASVVVDNRRPKDIRLLVHFTVEGVIVARGEGHLHWVTPEVFVRLRGQAGSRSDEIGHAPPAPSLFAEIVGRRDQSHVVVEPDAHMTGRLRLRLDPAHTTYFDHPQDHLPATLAAEAVRQAALLTAPGGQVLGLHIEFRHFTELDAPVVITTRNDAGAVEVELRQQGVVAAVGCVVVGARAGLLEVPAERAS